MDGLVGHTQQMKASFAELLPTWAFGKKEFVIYFEAGTALMGKEVLLVFNIVLGCNHLLR